VSELMSQMSAALRARHCSHRTEQAHCLWVRRYIRFHSIRHRPTWPSPRSTPTSLIWPWTSR